MIIQQSTFDRQLVIPPVMQVRSAGLGGAFSPADIGGLKLWLKADAITGLIDGDAVTTWIDSSGTISNFSQSTVSKKPLFKTNIINSLPVVRFDGTDDEMDASSTAEFDLDSQTVFVVLAQRDLDTGEYYTARNSTGTNNIALLNYGGVSSSTLFGAVRERPAANYLWRLGISGSVGTFRAYSVTVTGQNHPTIYANGTSETGTTGAAAVQSSKVALGKGQNGFAGFDLAEQIVYNSVLSAGDRQSVEQYLSSKYALGF